MKLLDVIVAVEGRVSGGCEYMWNCWGPNARYMDFADVDGQEFCNCVFDTKTYDVYDIRIFVPGYDQCFIWFNPEFKDAHENESKMRDVDPLLAYDKVFFTEVDKDTIMEYVKDVAATYYDNLPVPESV